MYIKKIIRLCSLSLVFSLISCGLNPQTADTDINVTLPETKTTVFSEAINKIGLMGTIHGAIPVRVMAKDITDNTGTSAATKGEIPRNITNMVKSALNGIGEGITFIPYDPTFMINSVNTGYSNLQEKLLPDVVVSGGITEFDRGLVTKGDSFEVDIEFLDMGGINFADENKASLASITLDFNLIDFRTFAGIPRIQAINGIQVHKGLKEDSLGFTIKSATIGARGSIKKVQGRHAAVRLLVQLSMIQIIGRYQALPYWQLIPGAKRDEVVLDRVLAAYYNKSQAEKIAAMQSYLYLQDYPVNITGQLDAATQSALQQFAADKGVASAGINEQTYVALFENVPINRMTKHKRQTMQQVSAGMLATLPNVTIPAAVAPPPLSRPPPPQQVVVDTTPAAETGELKLWTNQSEYNIGQSMRVNFSVNEPMYVRIVVINSKGQVSTLYPNVYQSDNYTKPGRTYQVPPQGATFSLDIGGPAGTDKIRAIASRNPIPAEVLSFNENGDFDETKMSAFTVRASTDIRIQ